MSSTIGRFFTVILLLSILAAPGIADDPPGLLFSNLLKGTVLRSSDGKMRLDQLQAVFLPGGTNGWTVLRRADSTEVYRFDWTANELKAPFTFLDIRRTTNLQTGAGGGSMFVDMATPGDYVLDFYADSRIFYTFPFSVEKLVADDPFAGGDRWSMDGAWRDWGYLMYVDANPERQLLWKIWLRNPAIAAKDVRIVTSITRDRDRKLICVSREGTTYTLRPEWIRAEFDLIHPPRGTSGGAVFTAAELLANDGTYTLEMKIDGQPYGTWRFTVKDGKLQYVGRAERGKADPLTFVEGGRDAWWYCRVIDQR
jgi:hypothetical protein